MFQGKFRGLRAVHVTQIALDQNDEPTDRRYGSTRWEPAEQRLGYMRSPSRNRHHAGPSKLKLTPGQKEIVKQGRKIKRGQG